MNGFQVISEQTALKADTDFCIKEFLNTEKIPVLQRWFIHHITPGWCLSFATDSGRSPAGGKIEVPGQRQPLWQFVCCPSGSIR